MSSKLCQYSEMEMMAGQPMALDIYQLFIKSTCQPDWYQPNPTGLHGVEGSSSGLVHLKTTLCTIYLVFQKKQL